MKKNNRFQTGKYKDKLYLDIYFLDHDYIKFALQNKLIEL